MDEAGRYKTELRQFSGFERVEAAISRLFAHYLNYLVNVISLYKKGLIVRVAKVAFGSVTTKFDKIQTDIRDQAWVVDRELRTASEESQLCT